MNTAKRIPGAFVVMIGLSTALLICSCNSKSTESVPRNNVVTNYSFEYNGKPWLTGWTPGDSDLVAIVAEPAPQSGFYSLQLTADWAPTLGYVNAVIGDLRDGDIVRLSAFVRAKGPDGGGAISMNTGDPEMLRPTHSKGTYTASASWTLLTVIDTLHVESGESAWIRLSSLDTEIVPRVGQFDRVTLERLDD